MVNGLGVLPDASVDLTEYDPKPVLSPSFTYKTNINNNHTAGYIDGDDALKQAIIFALNTEQGKYEIYPEDYGMEMNQLIGVSPDLARARLPLLVEECLMQDLRIDTVEIKSIETQGNKLFCRIQCNGNIDVDYTVDLSTGEPISVQ